MENFYTFKRGSIVMVNFSPQVGSEIKGYHFAIVLTKKDRYNNELLTVLPLTSKYHKYHIDFGNEIKNSFYNTIVDELEKVLQNYSDMNNQTNNKELKNKLDLCQQVYIRYQQLKEHTFGKPHQITTISKKRILKPINALDPIRSIKASNEIMDKIDKSIIELFTK